MYSRLLRRIIFIIPKLLLIIAPSFGQLSKEPFGKNRMQYTRFDWNFFATDNFEMHYYRGGKDIAEMGGKYLEEQFPRLAGIIGYYPYSKTKVYIYNSIAELQQSNVELNAKSKFTIAGETDFVRPLVEVAHDGRMESYQKELVKNVTKLYIEDMMFGGSFTEMFSNSYLLRLPDWFIEGAASYIAEGWSVAMDGFIREMILSGSLEKLNNLQGEEARIVGHSIWNYIALYYGNEKVSQILNMTRVSRNEQRSIKVSLGVSFKDFMGGWQEFYTPNYSEMAYQFWEPGDQFKLMRKNRKNRKYHQIKFSQSHNYLAYTENKDGQFKIKVLNLNTDKTKTVFSGGLKRTSQKNDPEIPLIEWIGENRIAFIYVTQNIYKMGTYDMDSEKRQATSLGQFDQIKHFSINSKGNVAVMSAEKDGQNDLYITSLRRQATRRITRDYYDDIDPVFLPGSNSIVFASNRPNDTLGTDLKSIDELPKWFNLFLYNLDTSANLLTRLTNTDANEKKPKGAFGTTYYYLSDNQGIFHLYKADLKTMVHEQVTNFPYDIKDFDLTHDETGRIGFIMLDRKKEYPFLLSGYKLDSVRFTPATKRENFLTGKKVRKRIALSRERTAVQKLDSTLQAEIELSKEKYVGDTIEKFNPHELLDPDEYSFKPTRATYSKNESYLSIYRRIFKESNFYGPFPHVVRFGTNSITSSIVIDPLWGVGLDVETLLNSILENHVIFTGLTADLNFGSGKFFGEYQYLKNPIDYHARYERRFLTYLTRNATTIAEHKYHVDHFEVGVSIPLNPTFRVGVSPYYFHSQFYDITPVLVAGGQSGEDYMGYRAEMVFDNSTRHGLNVIKGQRGKLTLTQNLSLDHPNLSFHKFEIDLRNYLPIHRDLTFATKFFYGHTFGPAAKPFILGGMDNWILNKTEIKDAQDFLFVERNKFNRDLMFIEYVTSLRGFNYNRQNGEDALLLNAELRWPAVKYFSKGFINSNFLRNLQLIGFCDIGTSWTGPGPWSDQNENSTFVKTPNKNQQITSNFTYNVRNFRNPWLIGYGWGVRTSLLGYFLKFDMAWPYQDYVVKNPVYYVTLGHDF